MIGGSPGASLILDEGLIREDDSMTDTDTDGATTVATMTEPLIRTTNLTQDYGSVLALDGLDIEIPPGITGLVGANGAGKTTLLKIVLGLLTPTLGTVSVLGSLVSENPIGIRERIGYMPEDRCLPLDQTAADFVGYAAELAGIPSSEARRRSSETLYLVGLHDERFRYIGDFSTGMQQRVKLAQAIVHDPELVLLDEPASGLDPKGREQMLDLITRFGEFGINVVISSHILEDIEATCEWVVMLDGGKLIRSAPLEPPAEGDEVSVEVFGDPGPLIAALAKLGVQATVEGPIVRVTSDEGQAFECVRDALAISESSVRRLGVSLSSLEDLFLEEAGG
ncbi:MAG TPA: ABC transporter ATP-binding protein [Actinobacteria bacterium]|nr:ABC transporter ATP-binding protein [Actinomycetota bacterium]